MPKAPKAPSASLTRRQTLTGISGLIVSGAGALAASPKKLPPSPPHRQPMVDLLLVLAVDASGSVSMGRFDLQMKGYASAFRDPKVYKAVRSGLLGSIAVTMVQWTGPELHVVAVPWTRVSDQASLIALAGKIEKAPRELFGGGTSISGAIDYSRKLLKKAPWRGMRKVIDISADGYNSSGRMAREARDEAVKAGVIINGLPILAIAYDLDKFFSSNVIGGPGAFSIPAANYDKFAEAIVRKLVLEIAGQTPETGAG